MCPRWLPPLPFGSLSSGNTSCSTSFLQHRDGNSFLLLPLCGELSVLCWVLTSALTCITSSPALNSLCRTYSGFSSPSRPLTNARSKLRSEGQFRRGWRRTVVPRTNGESGRQTLPLWNPQSDGKDRHQSIHHPNNYMLTYNGQCMKGKKDSFRKTQKWDIQSGIKGH